MYVLNAAKVRSISPMCLLDLLSIFETHSFPPCNDDKRFQEKKRRRKKKGRGGGGGSVLKYVEKYVLIRINMY